MITGTNLTVVQVILTATEFILWGRDTNDSCLVAKIKNMMISFIVLEVMSQFLTEQFFSNAYVYSVS